MLKRLSDAISQSNSEGNPLVSDIYFPNHSSCNFNPNQNFIRNIWETSTAETLLKPPRADRAPRSCLLG